MELPISVLAILVIGILVVIAVVVGIILPAGSGISTASGRAEFTVVCNEWGAKKCSQEYFDANKEKIEKAVACQGFDSCQGKCSASGLC